MIIQIMKIQRLTSICVLTIAAVIGTPSLWAKPKAKTPEVSLTSTGKQLEAQYAKELESLKSEITRALPMVTSSMKSDYQKAREDEVAAEAALTQAQKRAGEITKAEGLVKHAKGKWIGGADKGIKEATAKLKAAKSAEERQAAEKELANWQKNREEGLTALKERQAILDKAKRD